MQPRELCSSLAEQSAERARGAEAERESRRRVLGEESNSPGGTSSSKRRRESLVIRLAAIAKDACEKRGGNN
jgi:hypothetical protein